VVLSISCEHEAREFQLDPVQLNHAELPLHPLVYNKQK